MTPDERAVRAERVIAESVAQFRELAEWAAPHTGSVFEVVRGVAEALASTLARNARIAGINVEDGPPAR